MFSADPAANCSKRGKTGQGAAVNGPVIFFLSGHPGAADLKYSLGKELSTGGFLLSKPRGSAGSPSRSTAPSSVGFYEQ